MCIISAVFFQCFSIIYAHKERSNCFLFGGCLVVNTYFDLLCACVLVFLFSVSKLVKCLYLYNIQSRTISICRTDFICIMRIVCLEGAVWEGLWKITTGLFLDLPEHIQHHIRLTMKWQQSFSGISSTKSFDCKGRRNFIEHLNYRVSYTQF